ncbi:arylsulfatase [Paludibaculum fermentans]|uniref:arylsulfatase n=1 Tax=Paludibaculum fermentans TaxID=1473598 RepID=UPI003EBFD0DF
MNRRTFTQTLAAAPALLSAQPRRKPNIVWIMADDMGPGDLGCYGQKHIRTPNIDRLAKEGTLFRTAYAGGTVCAPSRSSLMTGQHNGHTAIRSNPGGVPLLASEGTVADVLKSAGYTTALCGKWGLGDIGTDGVPWKHGFDQFFGTLHQAHAHFQYPRFLYENGREYPLAGNVNGARVTYANDVIASRAVDFIRQSKDKPFFLYHSPTMPHFEPQVPEDSMAEYRGKFPMGKPWSQANNRLKAQPDVRTAYAAMVSRVDSYVGRIMAELRTQGLDQDTLVFFTSDNGATLPEIGEFFFDSALGLRGHKGNLYEGGVRAPMIARWPGHVAAGRTSDFQWYFPDFLPTAAEVAGVRHLPKGIDGISVLPTLLGQQQKPHEMLYWENPDYGWKTQEFAAGIPMQAMRRGHMKAVRPKQNGVVELYDLASDPTESKDLAAAQPKLAAQFDQWMRAARTAPRVQKEPPHGWWEARS